MIPSAKYHELSYYTLSLQDEEFIHQHVVDAYTAQTADSQTKNISLFFALAGLYLFLEKNYTGKQVQEAHQIMASRTKNYPKLNLPEQRGDLTVDNVLAEPEELKRKEMIKRWCVSVWDVYANNHKEIILRTNALLAEH